MARPWNGNSSCSAAWWTARLDAAVTNLGVQNELDVISAAVIGGTSFAGGIGTIPGAVLGAVVMQSLRSGMVLLKIDSPSQDIVVDAYRIEVLEERQQGYGLACYIWGYRGALLASNAGALAMAENFF